MNRVFSPVPASTRSAAAITPSTRPPLEVSMNGYPPLKKVSPMWTTSAFTKRTIASPSVWAGGTWYTRISSPFQWNVTASVKVTTGSAPSGEGGIFRPNAAMNCSALMRRRTFSCATRSAPALPMLSLPPVWSPCQWVLTTKRTGSGVIARIAARILSVRGAYWSSIR